MSALLNGSVWDASVLSRAHPGGAHHDLYRQTVTAFGVVAAAAPAVFEVRRGALARHDELRFANQVAWLDREEAEGRVAVVPFGSEAALAAAVVLSRHPLPPTERRRGVGKPEARVAWVIDIMIGACAWAAGRGVLTSNRRDLEAVARELAEAWPNEPLTIHAPDG